MLKLLFEKLRNAPGPAKQARMIGADIAEELVDLAEHYWRRYRDSKSDVTPAAAGADTMPYPPPAEIPIAPPEQSPQPGPVLSLPVSPEFEVALKDSANQRKQEFKVLAILWDADQRNMGLLSSKAMSAHGEKLGLSIRHENVRKVIRMRLGNYVITSDEPHGNSTIFKYRISASGSDYFASRYLAS